MSKLPQTLLFLICFFASSNIGGCAAGASGDARAVRAYDIVDAKLLTDDRGGYRLVVKGRMRTGGHANPRLRPVGPIRGGDLLLELVAQPPPPGTPVPMLLQPVSAEFAVGNGDRVKWVHVLAETNAVRRRLPRR